SNEKKLIQMIKIHIDQNVADLLTKAFDRIIHKGWLEWNAKAAKNGIGVKTSNSRVNAVGPYLVLLGKNTSLIGLTFADSHNMVAYLEKSIKNADFAEIVDFMNVNPIRYALTIHSKVEGKTIVISESSVRKDLQFDNEDEAQTRFETASKQSNDPLLLRFNTLRSKEDRLKLKELMDLCTKLSDRVLDLETRKTAQAKAIASLKKRVKKLERKRKSKTLGGKHSLIFEESDFDDEGFDADIDELFKDVEGDAEQVISVAADEVPTGDAVNTAGTEFNTASAPVTTVGVSVSTAEPITTASVKITTVEPITPPPTTTTIFKDEDLIIAQTLVKMRSEKSKVRGVVMQEPSETTTRPTIPPQQHDPKGKGKGKMVEQEKPLKKKDQIKFDEEIAQRLQAQMQAELEEEERMAREREEDANIAE
ncbi:hypothetical protein Tco_1382496, partial [Tanacetum coccineum]